MYTYNMYTHDYTSIIIIITFNLYYYMIVLYTPARSPNTWLEQ